MMSMFFVPSSSSLDCQLANYTLSSDRFRKFILCLFVCFSLSLSTHIRFDASIFWLVFVALLIVYRSKVHNLSIERNADCVNIHRRSLFIAFDSQLVTVSLAIFFSIWIFVHSESIRTLFTLIFLLTALPKRRIIVHCQRDQIEHCTGSTFFFCSGSTVCMNLECSLLFGN